MREDDGGVVWRSMILLYLRGSVVENAKCKLCELYRKAEGGDVPTYIKLTIITSVLSRR